MIYNALKSLPPGGGIKGEADIKKIRKGFPFALHIKFEFTQVL
jgi:hypothetical protein